ncbi:MAG: thioredoxin family protein [Planctomycetota bacterium]
MARTPSTFALEIGSQAPDFSLPNIDGADVSLRDFAGKPVVVMFICNHCPFVKHLADALASFGRDVQSKGVGVVAISSNDVENYPDDSPEKMKEEAERVGYTFPYVFDESQDVAKQYHAACTPDFFVLDASHRLAYAGQFDDARPGNEEPVTGNDLRHAVNAVLNGETPGRGKPSIGCNIKWKPGNAPTYAGA